MSYTCGTGAWSGPLPGDPDNNSILTASPVFGGIDISWTIPTVNAHAVAHTYLYRSVSSDFVNAVRIAVVGSSNYFDKFDKPEDLVTQYYWIRFVSINGTVGELIGPAAAVPRLSIDETIIALTARIDEGFLAESLRSEIDRIKLLDLDLAQEIQDRITANELLGSALAAVQSDTGQAVTLITQEVQNRSTAYNALLQSFNILAAGVADNTAAIINEQNIRTTLTDSFAQDIDTLYAESGANTAAITAESIARTNAIEAVSQTFEGLLATTESELTGTITAAITTEQNARTSALDAVATQITALQAAVANTEGGAEYSAALEVEQSARVAEDLALANQISTVQSTLSTKGKAIFSATAPAITDRTENNVWYDTSNGNNTPKMWNGTAWVGVSDKIALDALTATVTNAAAIQTETNARISADAALATQITTAQSTLGNNLAAAQTTLQTNINTVNGKVTQIGALYTAKVQANGLIGGFGVYNDGTEVQAGFDVDTFWVGRTGPDKKKPFIIDGATGEVFINNAVINKLTADKIDSRGLTIKDSAGNIIFGSGNNLDWSRIAGSGKPANNATVGATFGTNIYGQITGANVTTYIANAAIGNAQIGGDIWSNAWNGSNSGWYLQRHGNLYAGNAYIRGDVEASSLKAGIAMVDALNIKGSAMIIPIFISHGNASWDMPYSRGTWQAREVWKYTFTTGTTGTFRFSFGGLWSITHWTGHANYPNGTVDKQIQILLNGNVIETVAQEATYSGTIVNFNIGDRFYTLGPGTHTISVYMSALMADGGARFSRSAGSTTIQSHSQGSSSI